jgi:hypothetical protein
MRPVIGITTYAQEASWGVWRMPAALIPLDYVDAVERAGGRPVLIPPSEEGIDETLDALDGVVFSGGADVDPTICRRAPTSAGAPRRRQPAAHGAPSATCRRLRSPRSASERGAQRRPRPAPAEGRRARRHKQIPGEFAGTRSR